MHALAPGREGTTLTTARRRRRGFGTLRRLPSRRFQASYVGPDGRRHTAPATFDTYGDAEGWLARAQADISRDEWHRPAPPKRRADTFAGYSAAWLATRPLTARTRSEYGKILATHLLPAFGALALDDIDAPMVRGWYAGLATGPTRKAHAYALLKTILATAVADDAIPANPCRIRGAGLAKRARKPRPATLAELAVITEAVRPRWQAMILLAAWCGLRFGELAELRRADIDLTAGVVRVRRAVTDVAGQSVIGTPKSAAGVRDVTIPPHLLPLVADHLAEHVGRGQDALLFTAVNGGHLRSSSRMHEEFHAGCAEAGRPDLTFHGLRHTGATLAAATGATLAELMHRLGHSTPGAAMLYQHASADRDAAIAAALSDFHDAKLVALRPRKAGTG